MGAPGWVIGGVPGIVMLVCIFAAALTHIIYGMEWRNDGNNGTKRSMEANCRV
jgi:hypothetical protein